MTAPSPSPTPTPGPDALTGAPTWFWVAFAVFAVVAVSMYGLSIFRIVRRRDPADSEAPGEGKP